MIGDYDCFIVMSCFSMLVLLSNIYMVVHISRANNPSFGAGLLFKLIGLSNSACGIVLTINTYLNIHKSILVFPYIQAVLVVSFLFQLGFNVSLAFERLQVVKHGIEYHTSAAKRRLEKKLAICVVSLSLLIAILCFSLRVIFNNLKFLLIPFAVSRILGCSMLCMFYVKLFFAMRSQNQAIAPSNPQHGEPSITNNEMIKRRRKGLQNSKMFFIGITSSFLVCYLPIMLVTIILGDLPDCNSVNGILVTTAVCFSLAGMVFDSIWYFYMNRRSRRV